MERNKIKVSTRRYKKYMVEYQGKTIHFGDDRYQQYKDSTPLRAYAHLDHGDKDRRRAYYARHGRTDDKSSAKYWSNKYLW